MLQYKMKVTATTYLWGGAGLKSEFKGKLFLFLKVDELGEKIEIGTLSKNTYGNNTITSIGELNAGEAYTLPLDDLLGVWARIAAPMDSQVECAVISGL